VCNPLQQPHLQIPGSERLHQFPHVYDQLADILPHAASVEDEGVRDVGELLQLQVDGICPSSLLILTLQQDSNKFVFNKNKSCEMGGGGDGVEEREREKERESVREGECGRGSV